MAVLEFQRAVLASGDVSIFRQAALERAINGDEMKRLIADFNRDWPDVTRTRELLVLAEEFGAA